MIKVPYKNVNGVRVLERELTDKENATVTSIQTNGSIMICTFFQGDEPKQEQFIVESDPIDELIENLNSEQINKLKEKLGL
jgi:hypothetical protein